MSGVWTGIPHTSVCCCFCYCWANSPDKIGCAPHSRVSTISVDSNDLTCISGSGLFSFFIASNHHCGTHVNQSVMFHVNGTYITSMVSVYFFTSSLSVLSHILMSISLTALVRTLAFPVSVSYIQWYTHTESVFTSSTLPCHWRAKLMPFNMPSKLMCWVSASGHNQQASSNTISRYSKATPIARELASTHTFSSMLSTHQSPQAGSSCCTDSMVSNVIRCSTVSLASPSQPFVTELAHLLSIP